MDENKDKYRPYLEEFLCEGETLPIAYHKSLLRLQGAQISPCPDWNTNQKEISATLVVHNPLKDNMISKLSFIDPEGLEQYCQEMLDGILDFEVAAGKWKYTYHQRYAYQYQFIIDELKRNPDSRRAAISIRNDSDIGSEDPACLQHLQFFIRDKKLYLKVLFRSNDACKAAFSNAFALIQLQKRVADDLGVSVGEYIHRANSYHCYERDFLMLDGYCSRILGSIEKTRGVFDTEDDSLTYSYYDDWKEQMDEAKPSIVAKVEQLKKDCGMENFDSNQDESNFGHWEWRIVRGNPTLVCSKCKCDVGYNYQFPHCPNCGFPMTIIHHS